MILDEISLHNFGLYEGHQSITLTPASQDKPIVLFGGLNGGGKTTLLDALQLCLFGGHAKTSSRGSLAYSEYLARCIHRGAELPEAGVRISFRHTADGLAECYVIDRSWRLANGGCRERLEVLKNGIPDPALADNWASQVDDFIPANIAHLFLFDGEQIERYASEQDSSLLIGTAIQNLLGLDMVDQLDKDLHVYERRKRIKERDRDAQVEIEALDRELREMHSGVQSLKQERASLRTHKIDRKKRECTQIGEKYRKLGGDLYDQRVNIEQRLTEADQSVSVSAEKLRELAAGALPLVMVKVLLESAESRDRQEEASRRARDVLDTLRTRDRTVIKRIRARYRNKKVADTLKAYFDEDRAQREALGKKETLLDLTQDTRSDVHALLSGNIVALIEESERQLRKHRKLEGVSRKVRAEYNSIPGEDSIAELARKRHAARSELHELEAQYEGMGPEIERLEREVLRREQALAKLLERDAIARREREDQERILRHSVRVRATLAAFRVAVIARHVRRIEQLVLESYQQLLRKASLVTRLAIDPTSYALTLFGRDGAALSPERLSAGERQLLAIALLWGLAKASGRPLPTAIDTPLGRLDTGHRIQLVERYLPFASHQVLLFSTDEEIAGDYLERLRPWIGRTYHLNYNDDRGSTSVSPGYFTAQEAA
jgi:DNA sulfur modification protein DndD